MLFGAKAGDVIWYFKTKTFLEISVLKYKEMLMAAVKDALEILDYGSSEKIECEIFGITAKQRNEEPFEKC